MKLYLMLKSNLEIINLSEKADGFVLKSFLYGEELEFQISVESSNDKWYLKSNNTVDIIDNNVILDRIELKEYQQYFLKLNQIDKTIALFCQPNKDINVYDLKMENLDKISIGSSTESTIIYRNQLTQPIHAYISKENNEWIIFPSTPGFRVYVNNKLITKKK